MSSFPAGGEGRPGGCRSDMPGRWPCPAAAASAPGGRRGRPGRPATAPRGPRTDRRLRFFGMAPAGPQQGLRQAGDRQQVGPQPAARPRARERRSARTRPRVRQGVVAWGHRVLDSPRGSASSDVVHHFTADGTVPRHRGRARSSPAPGCGFARGGPAGAARLSPWPGWGGRPGRARSRRRGRRPGPAADGRRCLRPVRLPGAVRLVRRADRSAVRSPARPRR